MDINTETQFTSPVARNYATKQVPNDDMHGKFTRSAARARARPSWIFYLRCGCGRRGGLAGGEGGEGERVTMKKRNCFVRAQVDVDDDCGRAGAKSSE